MAAPSAARGGMVPGWSIPGDGVVFLGGAMDFLLGWSMVLVGPYLLVNGNYIHRKTGVVLWKLWANQVTIYDTKWVISYVKLPEGTWDFRILDDITRPGYD